MAYEQVGGGGRGAWTWELYPPPYDFLAPRNSAPMPAPLVSVSGRGLGCDGKPCARCAAARVGVGLFDEGFDVSTWGSTEWLIAGGTVLVALAFLNGGPRQRERRSALRGARLDYLQQREQIQKRYRPKKKRAA